MEGIRFAWRIFSFSSDSTVSPSADQRNVTPRQSSSAGRSRSSVSRRRIPLHQACSVSVNSSAFGGTRRSVRPGAYEVIKSQGAPRRHRVAIPQDTLPGDEFTAIIGTQEVQVHCPNSSRPGNFVRVMVPGEPITRQTFLKPACLAGQLSKQEHNGLWAYPVGKGQKVDTFKIRVPPRVQPGMVFVATIKGKKFSVTCPNDLPRKRKIRVALTNKKPAQSFPLSSTYSISNSSTYSEIDLVETKADETLGGNVADYDLAYEKSLSNGWMRRLRPSDGSFRWVTTTSLNDGARKEAAGKRLPAYCRQIEVRQGKDQRVPTGSLTLVPACQARVGSTLGMIPEAALSPGIIHDMQSKSLDEKTLWLRSICRALCVGTGDERSIKMVIRRENLMEDSINALMSLSPDQLRKPWKIEFVHEPAVDSGGVTREWFQLVSEQIFDIDKGLWICGTNNQMHISINPSSEAAATALGDHLVQFRFAGRLLGRALYDQQIVKGRLAGLLYKHILGWPLMMQDLKDEDQVYHDSLQKLMSMDDIESMYLDFTVTEIVGGKPKIVELVPEGRSKCVASNNLQEYTQALMRYRMMDRNKPQLTEFLLGFFDVIPESTLSVFDPKELESMLCGLPSISVEDWRANTRYLGVLSGPAEDDPLIKWFWEIVHGFEGERKARLLQFVTGSAGLPSKGFGALRGTDNAIKRFTIHVVDLKSSMYPRAHTCFNRIDLPRYESKEDLVSKLETVLSISAVGFGMD